MSSSDNPLWLQLWRDKQTDDFHQKTVNQFLPRFWPALQLAKHSRIFVPLCGKSLDMIWLAEQGHEIIAIELSTLAIKAFFHENKLKPVKQHRGKFTQWSHGRIKILCGDFFALNSDDLGEIDTVYDRAALTALPEDTRKLYVEHMQNIISDSSNVFLLTIEDIEANNIQQNHGQVDAEITSLYAEHFLIKLTYTETVHDPYPPLPNQIPVSAEFKVYKLSGRGRV